MANISEPAAAVDAVAMPAQVGQAVCDDDFDHLLKLSVSSDWRLRVLDSDRDPLIVFEHSENARSLCLHFSELVDLVRSVRRGLRDVVKPFANGRDSAQPMSGEP